MDVAKTVSKALLNVAESIGMRVAALYEEDIPDIVINRWCGGRIGGGRSSHVYKYKDDSENFVIVITNNEAKARHQCRNLRFQNKPLSEQVHQFKVNDKKISVLKMVRLEPIDDEEWALFRPSCLFINKMGGSILTCGKNAEKRKLIVAAINKIQTECPLFATALDGFVAFLKTSNFKQLPDLKNENIMKKTANIL